MCSSFSRGRCHRIGQREGGWRGVEAHHEANDQEGPNGNDDEDGKPTCTKVEGCESVVQTCLSEGEAAREGEGKAGRLREIDREKGRKNEGGWGWMRDKERHPEKERERRGGGGRRMRYA